MELYEDILAEFSDLYPEQDVEEFDEVLNSIAQDLDFKIDVLYQISVSREKIHQLQENVFVTIYSDFGMELSLEFENGIDNGTQLNGYSFDGSLIPTSRTVEVLKDIHFDEGVFLREFPKGNVSNAKYLFDINKDNLLRLHRNQSYDNYVTGGGTNKTDSSYRNEYQELHEKGVFWYYEYEEIEVDVNFK